MPAPAQPVTVAVDANGADLGPGEVLAGAALAAERGVRSIVFGPAAELGAPPDGVEVRDAPVSIAKAAEPVRAVRGTPDASVVQTVRAVADGEAAAFVAGGSTGAAVAAGTFHLRRIKGVHRPALAILLPVPGAPVLFLDVGANAEARPEHLVQFAVLGATFAATALGIREPRVGLLANGEEAVKGTPLTREAHDALRDREGVRFVGNVEGDGITAGAADVVVTDGFTGNVALKAIEGTLGVVLGAVKDAAMSSPRAKAGGLLLRPALRGFRDEVDPELQGGAYVLGLRGAGVVPHGRFTRRGIAAAIELAARAARDDLVGRTHAALTAAGALRAPAPPSPAPANVPAP